MERGSPHSLPLMESGKVTQIHIKTAEKGENKFVSRADGFPRFF